MVFVYLRKIEIKTETWIYFDFLYTENQITLSTCACKVSRNIISNRAVLPTELSTPLKYSLKQFF